jgi:hypothetical protein
VIVRPAREDEIPYLEQRLAETKEEKVNLRQAMVWVAEQDGKIVGMTCMRLIFQVEPLMIFDDARASLPKSTIRKAVYGMAKEMETWVADRSRNTTGIHSYFAVIKDKTFKALARHWGLLRIYADCETWGRDL